MSAKIEIILACYNGESFLEEQVLSILNQTYPNLHLLIRDDCSTDRTPEIIHRLKTKFPSKITVIEGSENLGVIRNFATLLQAATANYVMFSDQDDIWLPAKVEKTFCKMEQLEQQNKGFSFPALVHTDLVVVDKYLNVINPSFWSYAYLDPKRDSFKKLMMQNVVTGCTMLINQPLIHLARNIPKSCVMHDWWIALIAAAFGKIAFISDPTILYRQHETNDTGAQKYGFSSFNNIRRRYSKHVKIRMKKKEQLDSFQNFFFKSLDEENRLLIAAYQKYLESSFWKKKLLFFKHRFFKNGFMRNFFELMQ